VAVYAVLTLLGEDLSDRLRHRLLESTSIKRRTPMS